MKQTLPRGALELETKVRHKVRAPASGGSAKGKGRNHQWELIPCNGWDLATGCGGGGSWFLLLPLPLDNVTTPPLLSTTSSAGFSRYCDIMDACRKTVDKAEKYTSNEELLGVLENTKKLCPPPKGQPSFPLPCGPDGERCRDVEREL